MESSPTTALLLALARGHLDDPARQHAARLFTQPVDWDALAELAALHGVVGLVRRNLTALGAGDVVPAAAWQRMQQAAAQVAFNGMLHVRRLAEVMGALRSAGIEPVALKGVALADLLYDDPALRPSTDLDVLIRPEELAGALAALSRLGAQTPSQAEIDFQRRYSYDLGCLLPPVAGKATLLELHWQLAPRGLFNLNLERWRQRAETFSLEAGSVLRFAPEEQLLHLALHMRKHRYVGLRWLADVGELVRRFDGLDWRYVEESARSAGLQTLLFTTLTLTGNLLGAPAPEEWLQRLAPTPVRRRLLRSVLTQNALLTPVEVQDAGWTRLAPAEVLLLDRPAAMARELGFRLFPPSESLAGFDAAGATVGQRVSLHAGRLAHRTATLLRRSP